MHILAEGAATAGGLLADLIGRLSQQLAGNPTGSRALGVAALVSWLVTASLGGYMLRTWLVRGGLSRRRATGDGTPPAVIFTHFGLAVTGLALWAAFVASEWAPLAWSGGVLLMPVVGLGISTLTLWTPYPAPRPRPGAPVGPSAEPRQAQDRAAPDAPPRRPDIPAGRQDAGTREDAARAETETSETPPGAEAVDGPGAALTGGMLGTPAEDRLASRLTDEVMARALTDDVLASHLAEMVLASVRPEAGAARRSRGHLAPLVPAGHGLAALTTMLLVMLAVVGTV